MAMQGLTARKSLAALSEGGDGQEPKRTLGPWSIVAMGIGAIIGAGIFVLTGTAAARYAGPAIMLSFVLGGIACAFVGLCYAELAAMLPVCGSSYSYTYATLGEIFAWIVGWDLVLEYAAGAATVAVGWSGYATSLLGQVGLALPPRFAAAPGTDVVLPDGSHAAGLLNLPAAAIVLALTALLVLGTTESSRFNNAVVAVKIVVVALFVGFGAFSLDPRIGTRSCRPTTAASAISAPAACCAALPWCSSPSSASTRSRPPPGKRRARSATCRSASWGRSSSARCSTSRSRRC